MDINKPRRILITGPAADKVLQGGGSGSVPAAVQISPLEGLRTALQGKAQISHLPYTIVLTPRLEKGSLEWEQAAQAQAKRGKKAAPVAADVVPDLPTLAKAARSADVVIFMAAGTLASEGRDLPSMDLPGGQAQAIDTLVKANPNVIVVLAANGAVALEPWGDRAAAILMAHYAGQAVGDALADVLTGQINPGGKLSYTFARSLADYPCHAFGRVAGPPDPPKGPGQPRRKARGAEGDPRL